MSADVNYVILSGRMVSDVSVKDIGQSHLVSGTIACNRTEKKDNEYKDVASFIDFQTWVKSDKQLEFYKSAFTKGSKILINGEMKQETWEKDGQKRSRIVIVSNRLEPIGSGKGKTEGGSKVPSYDSESGFPEDIPY